MSSITGQVPPPPLSLYRTPTTHGLQMNSPSKVHCRPILSEMTPAATRPLLLPTARTTTARNASDPSAALPMFGGHADEHEPGGRPDEVHEEQQPELGCPQHGAPVEFEPARAPSTPFAFPERLDEVALRRVADEDRESLRRPPRSRPPGRSSPPTLPSRPSPEAVVVANPSSSPRQEGPGLRAQARSRRRLCR